MTYKIMEGVEKTKVIFHKFYAELIKALPISDLLPEFVANNLLSGGQKAVVESRNTRKEKTEYFLDEAINRGLDVGCVEPFDTMIAVMENCDDFITRSLARKIKDESCKLSSVAKNEDTRGIDHKKVQAPCIKSHPQDIQTLEGVTVILEVTADGTMPLHYQWYYECDILPGKNKSFYSIFPVTKRHAGRYYCQVENQYGKVDSETASLVVRTLQPTKSSANCFCNKGLQMQNLAPAADLLGNISTHDSMGTFIDEETIEATFSTFGDEMYDVLCKEDFNKVRRKCLENVNIIGGLSLSADVKNRIIEARNLGDLFMVLCCHCRPYWNWMNIRLLEKMAGNSLAAKKLIKAYKKKIFTLKVKDVISEISDLEIPRDNYTVVKEKWNKNFDDLIIQDIVTRWAEVEKKLNVGETILLKSITAGCVEICWLLCDDLVDHAIRSATCSNPEDQSSPHDKDDELQQSLGIQELFPEVLYLKIGYYVILDKCTEYFESRFNFDENLPEPEVWKPGPKIYPSQNVMINQGNDKPTIKLLINYEGKVAPYWHNLGIQLLQEKHVHHLDIIQQNHLTNMERCCTEMFKYWLNVDTEASWSKLINALEQIEQISLAEKIRKEQKQPPKQQQQKQQQQQLQKQQEKSSVPQQPQVQQNKNVQFLSDDDESVTPAPMIGLPAAYVLYDFTAKYSEELSVTANEIVRVMEDTKNGWLKVNRGCDSGYVPSAYVQLQ